MNLITCPFCQHETSDGICTYCFKRISNEDFNDLSPLIYHLEMSIAVKDYDNIVYYADQILKQKDDNLVYLYQQYALSKLNNKPLKFDFNKLDDRELTKASLFLKRNNENMLNTDILNINNDDLSKALFPLIDLRLKPEENHNKKYGIELIIFGFILTIITILISISLKREIRSFMTILLLIIPSLVFVSGITKLLKRLLFLREIFFILFLIILSYLSLIYIETNFINHLKNVLFAPYDFIKYLLGKVIINI